MRSSNSRSTGNAVGVGDLWPGNRFDVHETREKKVDVFVGLGWGVFAGLLGRHDRQIVRYLIE